MPHDRDFGNGRFMNLWSVELFVAVYERIRIVAKVSKKSIS